MPFADRERQRAFAREWHLSHKELQNRRARAYYAENRAACLIRSRRASIKDFAASPRRTLGNALRLGLIRRPTETPITVAQLMALWDAQGGRCAVSDIPMTWGGGGASGGMKKPNSVSLDRIDNDRSYELGNVRLICDAINSFRGRMNDSDMLIMAMSIVDKLGGGR